MKPTTLITAALLLALPLTAQTAGTGPGNSQGQQLRKQDGTGNADQSKLRKRDGSGGGTCPIGTPAAGQGRGGGQGRGRR